MHSYSSPIAFDERVTSMLQRVLSCEFVALSVCVLAQWSYTTLRANKATYAQGSGECVEIKKVTLSSKVFRLVLRSPALLPQENGL